MYQASQVNPSSMQVYASPKYKHNYFPESFIHIHIKHLLKYLKHNFPKDLYTFPSGSVNISMGWLIHTTKNLSKMGHYQAKLSSYASDD